jgi:threonine dehydrogenase-like Zn-dependent dehydrogenase
VADADHAREAAKAFTGGEGFPLVIEAAGEPRAVQEAFDLVSAAGRVVLLGLVRDAVPFVPWDVIRGELEIIGSRMSRDTIPQALAMIAQGSLRPQPMITHRFPLDRAAEALELAVAAPQGMEKVFVIMGAA